MEVSNCTANTYNFSVALPVSLSSPSETSFTVTFFCNGVTTVSDELLSGDEALEWAQDVLGSYGTWTLVDNTLFLSGSTCSTGTLSAQSYPIEAEEELILFLDNSSPQAIEDLFRGSSTGVSVNHQRVGDTTWLDAMSEIGFAYADQYTDPTTQWDHVQAGGDGYNIRESEATARGKTPREVLDGVGDKTYGYDFFVDEYAEY